MPPTVAVIVAAGESRRMGAVGDKQFALLAGRPVLAHTLRAFEDCGGIGSIVLVCAENRLEEARRLVTEEGLVKVTDVVSGGAQRQQSMANGLACVGDDKVVAIHDGARPLVTPALIEEVISALPGWDGVVPSLGVTDTVKQVDDAGTVTATLDRALIRLAQTPQAFAAIRLKEAVRTAESDGIVATDDAALVERLGGRVRIVEGSEQNMKITLPTDLELAESVLAARSRP